MNGASPEIIIRHKEADYFFELAKDPRTKQKILGVNTTKTVPPIFSADENPRSSRVPQEVADFMEQLYFNKGFGQEYLDDPKRYYSVSDADCRVKGRAILGPKSAKATITTAALSAPTIANLGFENGNVNGWADVDIDTVDANTGTVRTGTYSMRLVCSSTTGYAYYVLTPITPWLGGLTVTFTVYARSQTGTVNSYLSVDDGLSVTDGANVIVGSAQWYQLTVSKTLPQGVTQLIVRITGLTGLAGWVLYIDDMTFTLTAPAISLGATKSFVDFGGYHYAACGKVLLKWDGTDWDYVMQFPYTISDLAVFPVGTTNYLLIGQGVGYYFYYSSNGTSFTCATVAGHQAQFFSVVGGTLYFNDTAYTIRFSTDPTNAGTPSTAITIVSSATTITSLPDNPTHCFIGCSDGFYEYTNDDGLVTPVLPELLQEKDSGTCKNAYTWKNRVYVPTGLGTLYEYDAVSAVTTNISPSLFAAPTMSDFIGDVVGLWGDSEYLYAVLDDGADVQILAGHWLIVDDVTTWVWHHVATITGVDGETAFLSSYNSVMRLWIGCTDSTDGIYYVHSPITYGDVMLDTNYQMVTSGYLLTSWIRGKYAIYQKRFYALNVTCSNVDANKTIAVYYKKEFDSDFTLLGTISSASDNTLYFPSGIVTRRLQLKFAFASNSATSSPVLENYTVRAVAWPFDDAEGVTILNEEGEFLTYGGMDTSWRHDEYKATLKNFYYIYVISEGLSNSKYITVQYKIDDDAEWRTLKQVANESPVHKIEFPVGTTGYLLQVKFTLSSPTDTALITYAVGGVLRPPVRHQIKMSLAVGNTRVSRSGNIVEQSSSEIARLLREIEDTAWPVRLTLLDGRIFEVILRIDMEEINYDSADAKNPEYTFAIVATETRK